MWEPSVATPAASVKMRQAAQLYPLRPPPAVTKMPRPLNLRASTDHKARAYIFLYVALLKKRICLAAYVPWICVCLEVGH